MNRNISAAAVRRGRSQRGYSLVEMGVSLVVLGLVATLAVGYWRMSLQQQTGQAQKDMQGRAEAALLGYLHANFRLPCPDTDGDGWEGQTTGSVVGCVSGGAPTAVVGQLPWRTLGLLNASSGRMKYGVYTDLSVAKDRYMPLITLGSPPQGAPALIGNVNLFDLCFALDQYSLDARTAYAADTYTASALAVMETGGANPKRRHVAYVLASPGLLDADTNGDQFDGLNASASAALPAFEASGKPASYIYDDRTFAMSFDNLFGQLQCGPALSAAGHTHFNAAASTIIMRQGMTDYKEQLDLLVELNGANVAASVATVLSAAAGLAQGTADAADAIAFAIITFGAASGAMISGAASVAAGTAAVISAAITTASSAAALIEAEQRATQFVPIFANAVSLETSPTGVPANANAADAGGF